MPDEKNNPEAWTIGRLLNWTTDFFTQQGLEGARLDAEVLLAHCRGCQRILLYTMFDEQAPEKLRSDFRQLVRHRAAGKPVAYLVGSKEFYSLEFQVTPDVLIPRPETELLVVAILDHAKEQGRGAAPLAIADVGTGSGVLAVCAAKHLPQAEVTALDKSPAALKVASGNAERHGVSQRVQFVESDLFTALPSTATFDFVISNPPYISPEELDGLEPTVRDFEPRLALDGGVDGMEVIRQLVAGLPQRLRPDGMLLMEISPMIAPRVESLLDASPLERLETIKDLDGHARIVQAVVGSSS